jgi:hypothetical protein
MRIDLQANEFVLKASDTRHHSGADKVEGKLILTNQRLYFVTVNGTVKRQFDIETKSINEVMPFNNRFLFSNGLCLVMKDGRQMKFEVKGRNQWAGMIARVM